MPSEVEDIRRINESLSTLGNKIDSLSAGFSQQTAKLEALIAGLDEWRKSTERRIGQVESELDVQDKHGHDCRNDVNKKLSEMVALSIELRKADDAAHEAIRELKDDFRNTKINYYSFRDLTSGYINRSKGALWIMGVLMGLLTIAIAYQSIPEDLHKQQVVKQVKTTKPK